MNSKSHHLVGPLIFILITFSVYAIVIFASAGRWMSGPQASAIAHALVFDLLITIPALYYYFFIRKREWPLITLIPVALLNLYGAVMLISDAHVSALKYAGYLILPLEFGLIALIGFKVQQGISSFNRNKVSANREVNVFELIRVTARQVLGVPRVAEVLAFEIGIIYSAIFLKPGRQRAEGFSFHVKSAYAQIFWSLFIVMILELIAVHLVLWIFDLNTLAWILTGLSLYGLLWLIGDYKAIKWHAIYVEETHLIINIGLRWRLSVPLEAILHVKNTSYKNVKRSDASYLNTSLFGQATSKITLRSCLGFRLCIAGAIFGRLRPRFISP